MSNWHSVLKKWTTLKYRLERWPSGMPNARVNQVYYWRYKSKIHKPNNWITLETIYKSN